MWLQNFRLCVHVFQERLLVKLQALPSNIMFIFYFYFSLKFLAMPATLCLFGYLFCSSLRLNSQSSPDKVPASRLAPHVSWNNLARPVLLGAHPLNPGLSYLFIEPTIPCPPPTSCNTTNTSHPLAVSIFFPLASDLCKQLTLCRPDFTWSHV